MIFSNHIVIAGKLTRIPLVMILVLYVELPDNIIPLSLYISAFLHLKRTIIAEIIYCIYQCRKC